MRNVKVLFIYLFLIVYTVECLLFLFAPNEQKNMTDIKNTRIKIAQVRGQDFDLRPSHQAYFEEKKKNKNLKPIFLHSNAFSDLKVFQKAKKNNSIIPFRGPLNSPTLSCAEDLKYKVIFNDKYGFKNLNDIYEKNIDSFLLGDSYAEGLCETLNNDIAGNLNKKKINTVNFGVTGTGPLISLAILKEFGKIFKPKNIIYLYFEGNDLDDLNYEKKDTNLPNYLRKDYQVNYVEKYSEIKKFLSAAEIESEALIKSKLSVTANNVLKKTNKFDLFQARAKDILELNNLRNIFKYSILNNQKNYYDLNYFYSVIEEMKDTSTKLNSKYYFVYVPTWSRYFTRFTKVDSKISLKNEILNNLRLKNIEIIDLTDFFDNADNIKEFFPLGYLGHYNAEGYKKIAEIISERLN